MIGLDVVLIEEEISLDALVEVGLEVILILEVEVQVLLAACVDECIGEVEADGDHPLALRGEINELLLRGAGLVGRGRAAHNSEARVLEYVGCVFPLEGDD